MTDETEHCIFCDIVSGKAQADRVYEDEWLVAFWDARPVRPIHILIVPRNHIPTLNDIEPTDHILSHIGQAAIKIAEQFGVAQNGYRVFINVNRGGGQVIFHLHAHLIAKEGSAV
jgi:histidine triad (HIT) family protein